MTCLGCLGTEEAGGFQSHESCGPFSGLPALAVVETSAALSQNQKRSIRADRKSVRMSRAKHPRKRLLRDPRGRERVARWRCRNGRVRTRRSAQRATMGGNNAEDRARCSGPASLLILQDAARPRLGGGIRHCFFLKLSAVRFHLPPLAPCRALMPSPPAIDQSSDELAPPPQRKPTCAYVQTRSLGCDLA